MTTTVVHLTRSWTQVSTGSNTASISMDEGNAMIFDSATAPAADATGHLVTDTAVVTPPTTAWMRSVDVNATAVVS